MSEAKEALFWDLAEPLLSVSGVERSTMMGFPCLRSDGAFFASLDHRSHDLVVKLPADRVIELIEAGDGVAFSPAGRVFREWVAIPAADEALWEALMNEARAFVS